MLAGTRRVPSDAGSARITGHEISNFLLDYLKESLKIFDPAVHIKRMLSYNRVSSSSSLVTTAPAAADSIGKSHCATANSSSGSGPERSFSDGEISFRPQVKPGVPFSHSASKQRFQAEQVLSTIIVCENFHFCDNRM
jgi:hypothetical protein